MGVLVFTESGIKGAVPADVKLVIDDDQGQTQRLVIAAFQSRYYDASANAALYYECESRTALGGSATAVGPSGASGAGSNVMRQTELLTTPQAIMSTQAAGGGAHLSHVGSFRVFVRAYVPQGGGDPEVSMQLEWGAGDFRSTTLNDRVDIPLVARDRWVLVDLGLVQLAKVSQGTQRWEGRVNAWSTVTGQDIDLDRLILAPVDEGYCEITAPYTYRPGAMVARDDFTGAVAGTALNGRVAPTGGTWAESGSATNFTALDETFTRATTSDASFGHFAFLASTSYADVEVGIDHQFTVAELSYQGVVARWVDASNHVRTQERDWAFGRRLFGVVKVVGGVVTSLGDVSVPEGVGAWMSARIIVWASGGGIAQRLDASGNVVATVKFADPALATGGALASGKPGFWDYNGLPSSVTRYYDNFYAATPPAEPLAIAPGRSVEIRSNGASRQDSTGTLWVTPALEGFYPTAPPSWIEGRTLRALVLTCRGPDLAPCVWADPGIDDVSARLTYTPRYLNLPEA